MRARARLCLLLGKVPGELGPDKISFEEVAFLLRVHDEESQKSDRRKSESLENILGVSWDVDEGAFKKELKPLGTVPVKQTKVFLPLSSIIGLSGMSGPKPMLDTVDKMRKNAQLHNLGMTTASERADNLSREEYKNIFGGKKKH